MITGSTDYSIQRLRGLSTDTKPTDVPNGSEFREMDTGKKFLYSAAGTEWIEQQGSGGGSGGGGSVEPLVVHSNVQFGVTKFDKTWQEIYDALRANKPVYYSHVLEKSMAATFVPIGFAYLNSNYVVPVMQQDGTIRQFTSETADGFPSYKSLG